MRRLIVTALIMSPALMSAGGRSASGATSVAASTSASASASDSIAPIASSWVTRPIAPDPEPLVCNAVFVLRVHFDKGDVSIAKVTREVLKTATTLPRRFGRFAAELYVGDVLLERARFNFPFIQDDDAAGDAYAKKLDVMVDVRVPDSDRPTRLELWDRATGKRWIFRYPLKPTP